MPYNKTVAAGRLPLAAAAGWLALLAAAPCGAAESASSPLSPHLEAIRAVGREGAGNAKASRAWKQLVEKARAGDLTEILTAMDGTGPVVENWLGAAVEAVADRAVEKGIGLDAAALESFVLQASHSRWARRLALLRLQRLDAAARDRILPRLLNDPAAGLRREAVDWLLAEAARVETQAGMDRARPLYRKALDAAREPGQVRQAARKLGEKVDMARHFGCIVSWKIIGPFDNTDERGFDVAYGPERSLDLDGERAGKKGPVRWKDHVTAHELGQVDLNRVVTHEKAVIAYAFSPFTTEKDRDVELRVASQNAWKLWLDGKLLFARHEYHRGTEFDHFRLPAHLKEGRHRILLKVCQNEQPQDFADVWRFQLRVCDSTGTGVLSSTRPRKGGGR